MDRRYLVLILLTVFSGCSSISRCPAGKEDLEIVRQFTYELYNDMITIGQFRDLVDNRLNSINNRPDCKPIDLCDCNK